MSKKMVVVCDSCDTPVENGDGIKLRLTPQDASQSPQEGDLCVSCATELYSELPAVSRRGRQPAGSKRGTKRRGGGRKKATTA